MNRVELIENVSKETGFTKKDLAVVFDAIYKVVFDSFTEEPVTILPGITVEATLKKERSYHNFQNGGKVLVPAHYVPKVNFTARWENKCLEKK